MRRSDEGYDSPMLVSNRIGREYQEGRRLAIHRAWAEWQEQKVKPAPPTEAVWLDHYLVDHALAWQARQRKPSILWYGSDAVGQELRARGVQVYGAGAEPPREAHDCAMSIQAHGIGKNLQAWERQLVIEPPSSGTIWEQLLGRMHRQGQEADEVSCRVMHHAEPFTRAFEAASSAAQYVETTSGNSQKLLYASIARITG